MNIDFNYCKTVVAHDYSCQQLKNMIKRLTAIKLIGYQNVKQRWEQIALALKL